MTLTEADNGRTINVRVGNAVVAQLPENAASGFRWTWDRLDPDLVRVESSGYAPAGGAIGSGGYAQWMLKAIRPGVAELRLKLWRQWEGEPSVQKRFQATLVIEA